MRNKTNFTCLYWHKFVRYNYHFGPHGQRSSVHGPLLCFRYSLSIHKWKKEMLLSSSWEDKAVRYLMTVLYTNQKELQGSNENLHWKSKVWAAVRDSNHFAAPWFRFPTLLWLSATSGHARTQWLVNEAPVCHQRLILSASIINIYHFDVALLICICICKSSYLKSQQLKPVSI